MITYQTKKNNTLVSGNVVDEKNLHPGGRKFFLNRFSRDILFSSLISFAFFGSCFFFVVYLMFLEIKNVYSDTHSVKRAGE